MRYYAPANSLDDISGGTLATGLVPFDRICSAYAEDISTSDQTLATTGVTAVANFAPPTTTPGDLYLIEVLCSAYRAAGSASLIWSLAVTGTLITLRSLGDWSDVQVDTRGETVTMTANNFAAAWLACLGRAATFTDIAFRAQASATGLVIESGRICRMSRIGRA